MSDERFQINQVIHDAYENCDYRILWISPAEDLPSYWFRLAGRSNTPTAVSLEELSQGMETGRYTFVPDTWRPVKREEASEMALRRRDRAWDAVWDAVAKEPDIYDRHKRRKILLAIEKVTGITIPSLYKYIGRYWRYGKVPDALIPDYSACGSTRVSHKACGKPPARKSAPEDAERKPTADVQQIFQAAFTKYCLGEKKLSTEKAYVRMVRECYLGRGRKGNAAGPRVPYNIPSIHQFLDWYRKNRGALEKAVTGDSPRTCQPENRGSTDGTAKTRFRAPGMGCRMDVMTADIYLVSREDRAVIVGRPTLYFQMDCFSHMVMGMNVSLDPPSWEDYAGTMVNAAENKLAYCANYGITITPEDWPCMHIPSVILAERGEVRGDAADLCSTLRIAVESAPPYQGDLRGIIEKQFGKVGVPLRLDTVSFFEEAGGEFWQRGKEDSRLEEDAFLDLDQFTAVIIACVLLYNNRHNLDAFCKTPQMRKLNILPIPRELWNYGCRYLSGGFQFVDCEQIRRYLSPNE